jgi:hypothetical protein
VVAHYYAAPVGGSLKVSHTHVLLARPPPSIGSVCCSTSSYKSIAELMY